MSERPLTRVTKWSNAKFSPCGTELLIRLGTADSGVDVAIPLSRLDDLALFLSTVKRTADRSHIGRRDLIS
jgi:hypothetical protein